MTLLVHVQHGNDLDVTMVLHKWWQVFIIARVKSFVVQLYDTQSILILLENIS